MRSWSLLLVPVGLFFAAPVFAQGGFRASLNGDQEVPPVTTNATGWSFFILNADSTLTYFVNSQGLSATDAHIHDGVAGVSGPVIFPLSGGPDIWSGSTPALDAAQIATLRARGYYVNLHTAANPSGEIRGQIEPAPLKYGAHLNGDEENPPVVTSALGDATFTVNPDNSITYLVTTTGLTGTDAHIHTGAVGVNGPVLIPLVGGPTVWSGTTAPITADQFTALQTLGLYVNVHTGTHPGGEIRGQIVKGFAKYGFGCQGTAGIPVMDGSGAPTPNGTVTIDITGGLASSVGLLIGSFSADATTVSGCPFYLGAPAILIGIPLDASGSVSLTTTLPEIASFDLNVQYFNFDTGAANGKFSVTNGLRMQFTNY